MKQIEDVYVVGTEHCGQYLKEALNNAMCHINSCNAYKYY